MTYIAKRDWVVTARVMDIRDGIEHCRSLPTFMISSFIAPTWGDARAKMVAIVNPYADRYGYYELYQPDTNEVESGRWDDYGVHVTWTAKSGKSRQRLMVTHELGIMLSHPTLYGIDWAD